MREVIRVQTADGQVHESADKARQYLERKIADELNEIGDTLGNQKPMYINQWITGHLHKFINLKALHDDLATMQYLDNNQRG